MIKIEFPSNRSDIAHALGVALTTFAGPHTAVQATEPTATEPTATEPTATEPTATEPTATEPTATEDHHGVSKNPQFCSNAAKPFYASGPRAGQWKKRTGVGDAEYDAWYAEQEASNAHSEQQAPDGAAYTPAPAGEAFTPAPTAPAAAAFGATAQAPAPAATAAPGPADCGTFMGWAAKQQADGHLTQADIAEAYTACQIDVADLFGPDPAIVTGHVTRLYTFLNAKVGP